MIANLQTSNDLFRVFDNIAELERWE